MENFDISKVTPEVLEKIRSCATPDEVKESLAACGIGDLPVCCSLFFYTCLPDDVILLCSKQLHIKETENRPLSPLSTGIFCVL